MHIDPRPARNARLRSLIIIVAVLGIGGCAARVSTPDPAPAAPSDAPPTISNGTCTRVHGAIECWPTRKPAE